MGGELLQGERPVVFYSKKFTLTEARYHITDCELMAIYLACMKWQNYLHGNLCNVYTDQEPLIYIFMEPHLGARQACWLEHLVKLNLKVHSVPSVDNVATDVLSRFNQHVKNKAGQPVGRHSMVDASVACDVCTWLSVVAKHLNFDYCCCH